MRAHSVEFGADAGAAWGTLATGWPVEVTGPWLAAEAGRITPHQFVTYVADHRGWLAAATWLRLTGDEERSGYTTGELGGRERGRDGIGLPCASVVMPGTTQPAVVWNTELPPSELIRALSTLVAGLVTAATQRGLASLGIAHVPRVRAWQPFRDVLARNDFTAIREPPSTRLAVPTGGLPAYLDALARHQRKNCRREMRAFAAAGISVTEHGPRRLLDDDIIAVLRHRYAKYGHRTSTEAVRDRMIRAQGLPGVRVLVAEQTSGAAIAFKALVVDEPLRRSVSRFSGCLPNDIFAYFNITFYEPIRHAAALGLTSLSLGTGTYEPKLARGATLEPRDCFVRTVG